jgi:hypothetical protein
MSSDAALEATEYCNASPTVNVLIVAVFVNVLALSV